VSNKITTIHVFEDGELIYFKFPYNELAIQSFKQLPYSARDPAFGRGWNKGGKLWIFPVEMGYQVESLIEQSYDGNTQWVWCHTMNQILEAGM